MWYAPYLRVRRALGIYGIVLAAVTALVLVVRFWPSTNTEVNGRAVDLSLWSLDGWGVMVGATVAVAILATILGLSLASENDGHLEMAWTRPLSRERYALTIFGIDIAAIVVAILGTTLVAVIAVDIGVGHSAVVFSGTVVSSITSSSSGAGVHVGSSTHVTGQPIDLPHEAIETLAFATFPICIYAWITVLTASLKRNRGTIAGVFWPGVLILAAVEAVRIPPVHAILTVINVVNPIVIYSNSSDAFDHSRIYVGLGSIVVLLALAVIQWRRLEA